MTDVAAESIINRMSRPISGGCQCGAIRFSTPALLDDAHLCHCRMCQKAVGNVFAALVGVPKHKIVWTRGTPARFASSQNVERGFCANCGTPLFYENLATPELSLCIGAFDQPQSIVPKSQVGIESRMIWFTDIKEIPDTGTSEKLEDPAHVSLILISNKQHPDYD